MSKQGFFLSRTEKEGFYCVKGAVVFLFHIHIVFAIFRANPTAMKRVTLLLLLFAHAPGVTAQSVFSNETNLALQKVIGDYPNRFSNIKGDQLQAHARSTEYQSKVKIPGALSCVITQTNNTAASEYSWTCELFGSTDFEKSKNRFHELYNQIRNTIIKMEGEKPFILNGQYEAPSNENKATTIRFQFLPASDAIQQLKVELTLQYTTEWKIMLSVFDQEKDYPVAVNK